MTHQPSLAPREKPIWGESTRSASSRTLALLGFALVITGPSCALVFDDDYELEDGSSGTGNGGAGGAATQTSTTSTTSAGGEGGQTPECTRAALAIDHLFLGDKHRNGIPSPYAWEEFGADIDGLDTASDYSAHCAPRSGGDPNNVFSDGVDGIDNSFGDNFVEMFPTLSDPINANITGGNIGYIFDLVDLTTSPDSFSTRFYSGAQLDNLPGFDGTDCWPVDGGTVSDPDDVTTAKVLFHDGSVEAGVWVSGPAQAPLPLTLKVQSAPLTLTLYHATIRAPITTDPLATTDIGMLSGVLDTEEFVSAFKRFRRESAPTECGTPELANRVLKIRQASDIMLDGSQDPNEVCNGISVGLGFTAKPILLGGVGPASPPPVIPCP